MAKTTTSDIRIRLTEQQKKQLLNLAEADGSRSLSDYVRSRIFNDLSIHKKLDEIINKLRG
ncbi:hypothetical protein HYV85_02850 [Candidatus Woesearchaeota archaeon]|nr:hypothetical protein [Candidatus Woesearchaeota archaeon]